MTAADAIDVTTVGEALVDFVAVTATDLSSATDFVRAAGGAPANVAVAAARLGAAAAFVGAVGDDPFGTYLAETLSANGVNTSALRRLPDRTTLAFVARNLGGIPDFVFYRGADAALHPNDLPKDLLDRSAVVHVGSTALTREPSRSATLAAVEAARRAGALVSVDPNLRPSSWPSMEAAVLEIAPLLQAADVLKVNDEEARLFTAAASLSDALGSLGRDDSLVVITCGSDGCLWRWHGQTGAVGAPKVTVVDTTGAGDAFVGAVLAELRFRGFSSSNLGDLTQSELTGVLQFACAAGSISCTRTGAMTSLPTRQEVEELLAVSHEL
jgi:fructokinase